MEEVSGRKWTKRKRRKLPEVIRPTRQAGIKETVNLKPRQRICILGAAGVASLILALSLWVWLFRVSSEARPIPVMETPAEMQSRDPLPPRIQGRQIARSSRLRLSTGRYAADAHRRSPVGGEQGNIPRSSESLRGLKRRQLLPIFLPQAFRSMPLTSNSPSRALHRESIASARAHATSRLVTSESLPTEVIAPASSTIQPPSRRAM